MDFKKPKVFDQFKKVIEKVAIGILYLIFVYWSTQAFLKYSDEPSTTTIDYTFGDSDDSNHIELGFPSFTFCRPPSVYRLLLTEECGFNSSLIEEKNFRDSLEECLRYRKNLDLDLDLNLLMENLQKGFDDIDVEIHLSRRYFGKVSTVGSSGLGGHSGIGKLLFAIFLFKIQTCKQIFFGINQRMQH